MHTETNPDSVKTHSSKNLHKLVSMTAGNLIPTAVQRNSFIVNDIPRDFQIVTDEVILANILNCLLSTVVSHSKHSCIRISAKEYGDIIFVSVRDNGSFSDYTVSGNLEEANLLAKKMNGAVSIRDKQDKFTTILLSFPNFPKAA